MMGDYKYVPQMADYRQTVVSPSKPIQHVRRDEHVHINIGPRYPSR